MQTTLYQHCSSVVDQSPYTVCCLQAVEMYTDLREFDKAKQFLTPSSGRGGEVDNSKELLSKQAEWARDTNDPHAAWYV